jgi:DNA-binding transcriptional regulator GbsR (MarR family)
MKLDDARKTFIQAWGTLGAEWGINRTMAQIHALLLSSPEALDTDEIMARLQISRGNASTNLRALVDWNLVTRELRPGVRREFFTAEKDVWAISRAIAVQRRRRELDPLMKVLETTQDIDPASGPPAEVAEFRALLQGFAALGSRATALLDLVLRLDQSAFFRPFLTLLQKGAARKGSPT